MAETLQILRSRFSDYRIILSVDGAYANNILLSTLPLNLVIVKDPEGKEQDQYPFTTNAQLSPAELSELMAGRWSIEVAFWKSKTLLGLEDKRFWVKRSVNLLAPFVFLIESIVKVWFCKWGHKSPYFSLGTAEWYHKESATFSDMSNMLRAELLALQISRTSMSRALKRKIIRLPRNPA